MVIIQEKSQVIRYALTHVLVVSSSVAVCLEISGILHQNTLKIFTCEYAEFVLSEGQRVDAGMVFFNIESFLLYLVSKMFIAILQKAGRTPA